MVENIPSNSQKRRKGQTGRVLLHFGANKTGSTAIQNMLYENRQVFSELGLFYHDSRILHNSIQSGNGEEINLRLREGATHFEIKKLLTPLIKVEKLSIISCEGFSSLSRDHLNTLYESLEQLDIEFKILMYIRNPIDYYMSSYSQALKRHGYAGSFQDYVEESSWEHASWLMNLRESRQNIDVACVLFDQRENDLIKSFWESVHLMFNLDLANVFPENQAIVNRSLFQEEIAFLVMINGLFGSKYSTLISDFLLNETNFIGTAMSINKSQINKIAKRHASDVDTVNENFFSREPVVTFDTSKVQVLKSKGSKNYPNAKLLLQMLLYFMRNAEQIVEETGSKDIEALREQLKHNEYFSTMPDGELFDNVYYLLNNLDVARVSEPPMPHFLKWGKTEDRKWRTKKSN